MLFETIYKKNCYILFLKKVFIFKFEFDKEMREKCG